MVRNNSENLMNIKMFFHKNGIKGRPRGFTSVMNVLTVCTHSRGLNIHSIFSLSQENWETSFLLL